MARPTEGREALGFIAAALSGPILLALVLGLASGFSRNSLTMAAGALLFAVVPGTILFGLPTYYAIRKVRTPGRWSTTAFGAAISAMPVAAFAALRIGMPPNVSEQGVFILGSVMGLGAAFCGAVGGLVFWLLVFKGVERPARTPAS